MVGARKLPGVQVTGVLVIALAAFYATRLLRKMSKWLAERKPVGCNECMSGWASWALGVAVAVGVPYRLAELGACAGACLLLLELGETMRPPPVDLGGL